MMSISAREPGRAQPVGWSDPGFARVAEVVHLVAGLVFPPTRQASAESGMRRAMTMLRIADPGALARAVRNPGEERDAVLAELTIGETYFFRESAQLDVLRTDVLPSLLARRGADAPLRVWSAGCASGEEPYTIAILLRELGWPHPARILGTDVARPRLDAARRGRYTRWSLRGVSPQRIDRCFERRTTHFQLHPSIRAAVQFSPLNLVSDEYPSAATGTTDQDVVLCRNVLIYFDMESVARIATRLLAALAPDGWLLLGASDPPLSGLVDCETVMAPGGVVYRRADRDPTRKTHATRTPIFDVRADAANWASPSPFWPHPATDVAIAPERPVAPQLEEDAVADVAPRRLTSDDDSANAGADRAAYDAGDYIGAASSARELIAHDETRVDSWIVLVRSLANQGQLREADEQCVRALDLHRLSPELHYLHATLLGAAGQHREAANAARRALYLEPSFVMAQLQLGDALVRLGEVDRAVLAFESVARQLATADDDTPVAAADGEPASRLRQIAEQWLRTLGESGLA